MGGQHLVGVGARRRRGVSGNIATGRAAAAGIAEVEVVGQHMCAAVVL